MRFALPPRGSLTPNDAVDPLKFYYLPLLGRVFSARLELGLELFDGRFARLLEVGYGSGLLLPTLARMADVVDGLDLVSDPELVRRELGRLGTSVGELARGSVCAMPFAAERYDGVMAFSIFEHLGREELELALAEVARVLRPRGHLIVGCPAVHRAMNLAFAAIGFPGIEEHHLSGIEDVLRAAVPYFEVEKVATLPFFVPLGWALYSAVLLRKRTEGMPEEHA